jgi:hypothetical protein
VHSAFRAVTCAGCALRCAFVRQAQASGKRTFTGSSARLGAAGQVEQLPQSSILMPASMESSCCVSVPGIACMVPERFVMLPHTNITACSALIVDICLSCHLHNPLATMCTPAGSQTGCIQC